MSAALYQVTGSDPVLRGEALDQLLAELVGDDDRTLAVEEFTVPGRAAPGEAESDAPSGAEGREGVMRPTRAAARAARGAAAPYRIRRPDDAERGPEEGKPPEEEERAGKDQRP